MKAPSANHRLLKMVKLFVTVGPSSMCHSNGLNRLTRKSTTLTPMYANITHIQISQDRGYMKLKTPVSVSGFLIMILIPGMIDNNLALGKLSSMLT